MSEPGTSLSPANAVLSAVGLLPTLISGDFRYESGGRDTSLQIGRVDRYVDDRLIQMKGLPMQWYLVLVLCYYVQFSLGTSTLFQNYY